MRLSSRFLVSVLSVWAIGTGGSAFAADLFSFTYSNLDGSYDAGSMLFSAADDADTIGNVSRIISPASTAFFLGNGIDGFPAFASFSIETILTSITATTASLVPGGATLELVDVDGDVISADLSGEWTNVGGSAHFNGLLANVTIISDDGFFNGTDGSSFSTAFPVDPPFEGNVINLVSGAWFSDGDFDQMTTLTSGVVVPEPATLALFAFGGLALVARRRRK